MKPILQTLTVLALLVGMSGCFRPVRELWDWRWGDDSPGDRYGQQVGRDRHAGGDCWSDGRRYCDDGN